MRQTHKFALQTVCALDIQCHWEQHPHVTHGTSDRLYRFVGVRVRARRRSLEMTQEDLGTQTGLSRTSVTNLERGRQKVPLHQLLRIAEALDTDLRDLLPTRDELASPEARVSVIVEGKTIEAPPVTADFIRRVLQEERIDHGIDEKSGEGSPGTAPKTRDSRTASRRSDARRATGGEHST